MHVKIILDTSVVSFDYLKPANYWNCSEKKKKKCKRKQKLIYLMWSIGWFINWKNQIFRQGIFRKYFLELNYGS